MKKRLLKYMSTFLIVCCLITGLVGCGTTYQDASSNVVSTQREYANGYFTTLTNWNYGTNDYCIVYANDTKVKYLIINGYSQYGITPLYNSDGSLQIYEG